MRESKVDLGLTKSGVLLGVFLGASGLAILAFFFTSCETNASALWFCNEEEAVVLATLEFIQALVASVAWPIAVVLVALVVKQTLPDIARRLHKLGPTGIELYPHPGDQTNPSDRPDIKLGNTKLDALVDPTAVEIEEGLLKDLDEFDDTDKQRVLVRALTNSIMSTSFAIVYAHIFGSQIRALELLNSKSIERTEAEELFREIQAEDEILRTWDLDQYLKFLFHWNLIEAEGSTYRITISGRSFLQFLVQRGLSKDRLH